MQSLDNLLAGMTPEVYQRLQTASETGKWPDGTPLTTQQREHSLQLVMLWQSKFNHSPGHMSIDQQGQMVIKSRRELKEELGIDDNHIPLRFNQTH